MLIQEQRKKDARMRRRSKKKRKLQEQNEARANGEADGAASGPENFLTRFTQGIRGGQYLSKRRRRTGAEGPSSPIELSVFQNGAPPPRAAPTPPPSSDQPSTTLASQASSSNAVDNSSAPPSITSTQRTPQAFIARILPTTLYRSWLRLRHAHTAATQSQALEQLKIREEVSPTTNTWGLGSNGLRERDEAEDRLREVEIQRRMSRLIGGSGSGEEEGRSSWEDRAPIGSTAEERDAARFADVERQGSQDEYPPPVIPPPIWEERSSSFWWWGPLRRWRLQDRTRY